MKTDLKKILSMVWKRNGLKIGYMNKYIVISVDTMAFDNKNGDLDLDVIAEALDETPCRCTKEARALSETIKVLDDLTGIGYFTTLTYKKRKSLKIKAQLGGDSFEWEVLDVDKHDYSSFVRKLVKINKDMKKIA